MDLASFLLLLVVDMVLLDLHLLRRLLTMVMLHVIDLIRCQLLMFGTASHLLRLVSAVLRGGQVELLLPRVDLVVLDN